jgi:hypothetical protein
MGNMLNFSVYLPEFGWIGRKFPPNNIWAAQFFGGGIIASSSVRLRRQVDDKYCVVDFSKSKKPVDGILIAVVANFVISYFPNIPKQDKVIGNQLLDPHKSINESI